MAEITELIKTGENDRIQNLLQENPSIANGQTEQGISNLMFAIYCRNNAAVSIIKSFKSHIDLQEATGMGDIETVKSVIGQNPDLINSFSVDGFSPLGLACFFGQFEVAKYLVEKGANVNQPSNNPFRVAPIHSACSISNYPIAELLLKNGADVNVKQQAGVTPLHQTAHNGNLSLTQLLIDNHADVNAKMDNGKTPLLMAEEGSDSNMLNLIKKYGGE